MINEKQFRELIIQPALNDLHCYSKPAEEILVFTFAAESNAGTYLKQLSGPALGVYQMEPDTYYDHWTHYIKYSNISKMLVMNFNCTSIPDASRLVYDLKYATAMARIHYMRVNAALPAETDIEGIWAYYKEHYNTPKGAAQKDEKIALYKNYLTRG